MSNTDKLHFAVFVLASFVAFLALLRVIVRKRPVQPGSLSLLWVSAVVLVAGMLFAKVAANSGLPPWVYYGIPAATTIVRTSLTGVIRPSDKIRIPADISLVPTASCLRGENVSTSIP